MDRSRYSGSIRIRSCGVLIEEGKVLLIQLLSPVTEDLVWIPPGGKVEFGETLEEALKREFKEETGLEVAVQKLLDVNELVQNGIHAIEFYFSVEKLSGSLSLGTDPEVNEHNQLIRDLRFFSKDQLEHIQFTPDFIGDVLDLNTETENK